LLGDQLRGGQRRIGNWGARLKGEIGPLTSGLGPVKRFFQNWKSAHICKFKNLIFPSSKNIETLHEARYECFEQLSQLSRL
jgi:hypothetical protein